MTSREIAELTESRHDDVKRSIDRLTVKGLVSFTPMAGNPGAKGGRPSTVYVVNERDSYVIVAQLSPQFTARLVDRWQELEREAAAAVEFKAPTNTVEALHESKPTQGDDRYAARGPQGCERAGCDARGCTHTR